MKKAGLRRLFLLNLLITCSQRVQQQADQQREPRQARRVQQQERPELMRFEQLFHRMQPKRGSTELQSKQNDS